MVRDDFDDVSCSFSAPLALFIGLLLGLVNLGHIFVMQPIITVTRTGVGSMAFSMVVFLTVLRGSGVRMFVM